ncbi:hypothetical protein HDV62DRAFT_361457 [Trichoderma sp. SZMC 28011]
MMSSFNNTQLEKLWKLRELTSLNDQEMLDIQTQKVRILMLILLSYTSSNKFCDLAGTHREESIPPTDSPWNEMDNDAQAAGGNTLSADNSNSADHYFMYVTLVQQRAYRNSQGPLRKWLQISLFEC